TGLWFGAAGDDGVSAGIDADHVEAVWRGLIPLAGGRLRGAAAPRAGRLVLLRGRRRSLIPTRVAVGLRGCGLLRGRGGIAGIVLVLLVDGEEQAERHHQDRSTNCSGQRDACHLGPPCDQPVATLSDRPGWQKHEVTSGLSPASGARAPQLWRECHEIHCFLAQKSYPSPTCPD